MGQKNKRSQAAYPLRYLGLLLKIRVHAANITHREGAKLLLSQLQKEHSNVKLVWTEMGYSEVDFATWVEKEIGWKVQTIKGPRKWIRVREGEEPPSPATGACRLYNPPQVLGR